ncbi:MAG: hypothetical protein Fur0044_08300 [Anaerolineae bacterium]
MKKRWLQKWLAPAHGQSLVEMAITAPILIFMLLGVFEVGWALRGYLVLVNVNREITRFAVRPGYLDFSTKDSVITSYNRIYEWVETANSGELPLNFSEEITDGNATLIVAHLVVDTGLPCEDIYTNPGGCDCDNLSSPFTDDDLIIHPEMPNFAYQAMSFPPVTSTRPIPPSRIDYADLVANTLIPENNGFNCEIIKKGGVASANNLIITQMFFEQPQLFGFPLISNPLTDPVPMYAHTSMRLSTAARSSGTEAGSLVENISTIGPVCMAYPMIVKASQLSNPIAGTTQLDILDGNDSGSHAGWLVWDPSKAGNLDYLKDELTYPQLSLNDFTDPVSGDAYLSQDDKIKSWGGTLSAAEQTEMTTLLTTLVGRPIIVPVWTTGGFSSNNYSAFSFAQVEINSGGIDLANQKIMATFQGWAEDACEAVAVSTPEPGSTPTATATPNATATAAAATAAAQTATAAAQANATATAAMAATANANATATAAAAATANANATATAAAATATANANAAATAAAATATANANATATSVAATATAQAPVLTTIATDDLESWTGGGTGWSGSWSTGGGATQQSDGGSNRMRLAGNSNSGSRGRAWRAVDMQGVTNATLAFTYRTAGLDSGENGVVEVSTDGSNWTSIWTGKNNSYTSATVNLNAGYMVSGFQVRFRVNANSTSEYFYVDNIQITGYR